MTEPTSNDTPVSPFGPGHLDSHEVTDIEAQIEGRIQALPDADADKLLDAMEKAIKEKRSLGALKQGLSAVIGIVKPLLFP